jgi:serine/threonine protein kinase
MTRDLKRAVLLPMLLAAAGNGAESLAIAPPGPSSAARADTWIGPYRLLAEIGSGGMGTVWLAEQRAPVFRQVAVKLIRDRGTDAEDLVARFLLERQALAVAEHEHIARLYDAGTTGDGRPWLAMEYVPGAPLTEHCDRRRLDLGSRLELLAEVCDAVQHLHDLGIQHRDLKPDNVLVVERGGRTVPKLLDLGLSAFTDAGDDGDAAGTPTHMAPEQFLLPSREVDERADVHALGVMLYELLVGALPFVHSSPGVGEFRLGGQVIAAPSAQLAAAADPAQVAALRGTTPRRLRRVLRRGLDRVALGAVAADRGARTPSPAALARQVRELTAAEHRRLRRWRTGLIGAAAAAAGYAAGLAFGL